MESTQLVKFPKIETNPLAYDCSQYYQDPFHQNVSLEFQSHENILNVNSLALLCDDNQVHNVGFQEFEDLGSWDYMLDDAAFAPSCDDKVFDEIPLTTTVDSSGYSATDLGEVSRMTEWGLQSWIKHEDESPKKTNGGYIKKVCASPLEFVDIQKCFEVPINEAAKELKVGLTVLKRRCRELNIMRWPHRKIKSLNKLIENLKELGWTNEVMMVEEQKKLLAQMPDMELTDRTKKLRQAIFKSNHKKKRPLIPLLAN